MPSAPGLLPTHADGLRTTSEWGARAARARGTGKDGLLKLWKVGFFEGFSGSEHVEAEGFLMFFCPRKASATCLSLASSFVLEAVGSRLQRWSTAGLVKILGMGSTATNKEMKDMRDWLHATRDLLPQSSTTGMITALMLEPARPRAWFRRQQMSSSETYESDVRTVVTETSETKQPEWFRWDEMAEVTGSQQAKRGTRFLHEWFVSEEK